MKWISLIILIGLNCFVSSAQFVARLEVKEDIPGICDKNEVYSLFPTFDGQEEAICQKTKSEILMRLNTEIRFLKDNPKYKDKGMIGIILNCEGKVIKCEMDNHTKSIELDKQIEAVFNSLGDWVPGKLHGKNVDSSILYSFKIRKSIISFD